MKHTLNLRLKPSDAAQEKALRLACADAIGLQPAEIEALRVTRRSIDARQRQIYVNLSVDVYVDEPAPHLLFEPLVYPDVSEAKSVVVVGAGPGGLFAALRLVELGLRPVLLERGKDVHERRRDIALISRAHQVDGESNYSFGEGGAGAFSDGKLYTRSKKRGSVERVLRVLCQHGASPSILVDAHPHIGTDKLPAVVESMRKQIEKSGGEVHFQTRVDQLLLTKSGICEGVVTSDGRIFRGPVVLATGHSARDTYRYLRSAGIGLEAKGLAIGVRLEHPAQLIDRIQYHSREGRGQWLPAAEYSYVAQVDGRGVYSFCMCPGGFVVPAATGEEQVVVNGMSPSNRGGAWSNSGMVVETRPEDLDGALGSVMEAAMVGQPEPLSSENPLRMMLLQEYLERLAWQQGGRRQTAPAQRMADFVKGRLSAELPKSSYAPGVVSSPLHFWMPQFFTARLQKAFSLFGARSRGFLTNEAQLIAIETRTSSPVRISRSAETLQSLNTPGLFPCGEGAGYAGGIVSSAIDGERCAQAAAAYLG